MQFTAYIEKDLTTGLYIGTVPSIPGAHTQAETLEELRENMREVISLCLDEQPGLKENLSEFIGLTQVTV